MTEHELRESIVCIGRLLFERHWIPASDGNLSIKLSDNRILTTPAGVCKGMLQPSDLVICDLEGRKIGGDREPSSEMEMHLTVYRLREDVQSVVHAHPPFASGFAVAGRELDLGILPEVIVRLGSVPLARYGTPGTPALSEGMLPFVHTHDALLLENHGAVSWGENLHQAFFRMDTLEHYAQVMLIAELLGGARALPRAEIQRLFAARARYGVKSSNSFETGAPVPAEDQTGLQMTRPELLDLLDRALKSSGAFPGSSSQFVGQAFEPARRS